MAVGNTFGATALSSYGGFWISFAIIFTPGFGVTAAYTEATALYVTFSFYLFVRIPQRIPLLHLRTNEQ